MIKTNIKMRVTPEQSKKVQEICFESGINWGFNDKQIRYIEEPFIFIEKSLAWLGYRQEDCFNDNDLEEINANFFIRTNGTCIEEKEFTYPLWFRSKVTGDIVMFSSLTDGMYVYINEKYNNREMPPINKKTNGFIEHTRKDNWEQVDNPEPLDRLDDIVDETIKEVSKEDSHNAHYKAQKIDTITRCKANMSLEQQKAICIFQIDRYTHREKGQNLSDIKKTRDYLDWLEEIEIKLKNKE